MGLSTTASCQCDEEAADNGVGHSGVGAANPQSLNEDRGECGEGELLCVRDGEEDGLGRWHDRHHLRK